ncbi:hypothetical protein ITI46_27920 [Streptomyces oryzae]|uniref:PE-PGRS family protein n=1 Tax=Streptomyces oryzae TaxID=1434886 RepID=A0ABS3XJ77_9ACTN|nr:hypothetical protein [Streptomyces oryzae]MBO8195446.1 hypothetical protein [Streptomyces oryzae]
MTERSHPSLPFALPLDDPEFWAFWYYDEYSGTGSDDGADGGSYSAEESGSEDSAEVYQADAGHAVQVVDAGFELTLELVHPGAAKPVQLGWDDQAQWHPDALRWQEAELLCRAAALSHPEVPHPGPHLALLSRFAPVCDDADAVTALPLLREAFSGLPGLDAYQRLAYAAHADKRGFDIRWRRAEGSGHWYPDQAPDETVTQEWWDRYGDDPDREHYSTGDLYSLRSPDHAEFPFAALAETLERARLRCSGVSRRTWAANETVRAAAEAFAREASAAQRARLLTEVRARGCTDQAVLKALAPEAGPMRALAMTELVLGVEPGTLIRHHAGPAPRPLRSYTARLTLPDHLPAASLIDPLNSGLRRTGTGSVTDGPTRIHRAAGDGVWREEIVLHLLEDWQPGLEQAGRVLRDANVQAEAAVRCRGENISLQLG